MKALKNILVSTLLLNSFCIISCTASNPSAMLEGKTYKAVDSIVNTLAVLDSIRVYTGNAAGQEQITKLRSAGYTCKPALSKLWRCTSHLNQWNHDSEIVQSRVSEIKQKSPNLSFGKIWREIEKTHESEAYSEWEVGQIVTLGDLQTRFFRWRNLSGTNYLKLLPGKQGFIQVFLWSNNQLTKVVAFSISHKSGYTRYIIEIPYE